ncbi:ABC transporter ATP-binding protein [Flexistipes sp.]|uniref:ABC transporter ATP-binding protein n=1 Tax=Flexistipes sp. TaxID=3088135 RepID=UPI002E23BA49|nr:ABC transporter ATP-binding protein [Flexistipes sp.]
MEKNLIELKNLTKTFKAYDSSFKTSKTHITATDDITLQIKKADSLGIVGESGSGKTTLANLIAGILPPDSGKILYKNRDIISSREKLFREYRKNVQMIFQDPYSSLNPKLKIYSTLKDGIKRHITKDKKEIYSRCVELMEMVGLTEKHLFRYPHQFSGGQMQRISIARALSIEPEIVVADEPVSSLDVSIQAQILNLLQKLRKESGKTLLLIAHDLAIVNFLCDEILVMYKGMVLEYGKSSEVIKNPLHPYTKNLLEATTKKDIKKVTTETTGLCPYASRCKFFMDICRNELYKYQATETHYALCNLYK